jgi:uncharacterized protein YjbJ (UPF0337 family)
VVGSIKNLVGKTEEAVGNVTGLESLQTSGKERQVEGQVEDKQARAQGYTDGTVDRVTGAFENAAGSLTGDTSQEVSGACLVSHPHFILPTTDPRLTGNVRNEKGKVQQEANKP